MLVVFAYTSVHVYNVRKTHTHIYIYIPLLRLPNIMQLRYRSGAMYNINVTECVLGL